MEKNQQNSNKGNDAKTPSGNEQPSQPALKDSEPENVNRFAETSGSKEQHSERSSPAAENETLGVP